MILKNLIHYLLIWGYPHGMDVASSVDIEEADVLLAQSFGRNSFSDRELSKVIDRICVGMYSVFGRLLYLHRESFDPGAVNNLLARRCVDSSLINHNLSFILQWEVGYAFWEQEPELFRALTQRDAMHLVWPTEGHYLSTWEVNTVSVKVVQEKRFTNVIEVAQEHMVVRAQAILWRLGVKPKLLPIAPCYDAKSVQIWTRNPLFFLSREVLTRLHHLLKGWVQLFPPE